ncbi:MAG TPA: hypothetical protein DIV86_00315 [Alphaproteobacteria bacterium]|nr:hypothetical protein [Alphaproteobacteria bacterium]
MRSAINLLVFIAILFSANIAEARKLEKMSSEEIKLLNLAQDYLDKIKTIEASFIQFNPGSDIANGVFLLSKPGKLKMSYSTPFRIDYYINDNNLIQYDWDLDEVSRGSAPENPLKILLYQGLRLANNDLLEVADIIDESSNFNIYLVTRSEEITEISGMILKFNKMPLELSGVQRVSNDGKKTDITFSSVKINQPVDNSLLIFNRPKAKYPNSKN